MILQRFTSGQIASASCQTLACQEPAWPCSKVKQRRRPGHEEIIMSRHALLAAQAASSQESLATTSEPHVTWIQQLPSSQQCGHVLRRTQLRQHRAAASHLRLGSSAQDLGCKSSVKGKGVVSCMSLADLQRKFLSIATI